MSVPRQSVFAAQRLEKLVLDLETGTRGYVITRDPASSSRGARRAGRCRRSRAS